MNLLALLADKGVVKREDVSAIEQESKDTGAPVMAVLEKRGIAADAVLAALGEHYHLPYRVLPRETPAEEEALAYIPEDSARYYRFAPLAVEDGVLAVGVVDPDNIEAQDALQFISSKVGLPYKLYLITEADFNRVIDEYQNLTGEVGEALSEFEGTISEEEKEMSKKPGEKNEAADIKADAPVTKIVATILRYAVEGGASDIHIEPTPEKTRVRFRMDGDLHTSLELPAK